MFFHTLASSLTLQKLVAAFFKKPLLSFPQDLKPQIPVLQVLTCVSRYDNDIETAVRLTEIIKSISVLEMLKWEKRKCTFQNQWNAVATFRVVRRIK